MFALHVVHFVISKQDALIVAKVATLNPMAILLPSSGGRRDRTVCAAEHLFATDYSSLLIVII